MNRSFIILIVLSAIASSCGKSTTDSRPLSSYTIVNATTDVASIKGYIAQDEISWKKLPSTDAVAQYRTANFGALAGTNFLRAVNASDTTQILFSPAKSEIIEPATMNSLFLYGNVIAGYGALYLNNEVITNYSDSVIGVRFINLSPNSSPISVALLNQEGSIEANSLAYQQASAFKTYPSQQSTDSIRFILKDATTGDSLTKYVLPKTPLSPYLTVGLGHARFKHVTLVIKGLQGTSSGTNALGILPVPHY